MQPGRRRGVAPVRAVVCAMALVGGLLGAPGAFAKGSGDYAPIAELGVNFHNGLTGKSLTGSFGYFMTIRAEARKGFFRPHGAAEIQSDVGKASIGADTPNYTMYGAGFLGGVHVFIFPQGRFMPFFGGSGVVAWHFLKMTSPPTGVEPQTASLSFGYETSVGVDIRTGSMDGDALRIRSGFWKVTSSLAGVSGFQLDGFRITLGIVW